MCPFWKLDIRVFFCLYPNKYQPITILVARTQCVFSVSLRTGKRLARTTVKRIVISPADKQKQTTPTLSYYQSQSYCACIVSLEPGVSSGLYCLSAWELFLFKWNLQVRWCPLQPAVVIFLFRCASQNKLLPCLPSINSRTRLG